MHACADGREIRQRWSSFLAAGALSAPAAAEIFRDLDRRYREEHRHYHNWGHILACLAELDRVRALSPHPLALELAIWFHDAIYLPGAADNEARSARLAREAAPRLGLTAELAGEAESLVMATRHLAEAGTAARGCVEDTALVLDIDLAILGREAEVFDRYEQDIRREYDAVPPERHRQGRLEVLQAFLRRPSIYLTPTFQALYEARARENLARSVERLRAGCPTDGPRSRKCPG